MRMAAARRSGMGASSGEVTPQVVGAAVIEAEEAVGGARMHASLALAVRDGVAA